MDLNWKTKICLLCINILLFSNCENKKKEIPWKLGLVALTLSASDYYLDCLLYTSPSPRDQ
ncbi:MAG: hypothetical protein N3A69_02495, partial [Leptospiraceae bacterium]|nr:hypothetical protein [Leptospiraceae bacterium]